MLSSSTFAPSQNRALTSGFCPGFLMAAPSSEAPTPLLPRVALGEASAARECVRRYAPLIASIARRFFGSSSEVEDASQDIFLELWRCAGRFDPASGSEAGFIVMIARRRLIDRSRNRKRQPVSVDIADFDVADTSPSLEHQSDARAAMKAISFLKADQRQAIFLSTIDGIAHEEIAERMSLPLGTVKSHIRRGLSLVRTALLETKGQCDE
jgi:RNA polymerase sigma factor (sigma-70 family)